jgi:acetyl-CoA carboxylase carboxyltransferase component
MSAAIGTELGASRWALEWRCPYLRLLDASGSVNAVAALGRTYLPDGKSWSWIDVELLQAGPVVSIVLGAVAGLPAIEACLSHFSVMLAETGQVFAGGPPVVKAALGLDIKKKDLGGAQVHTRESGVIDNVAVTEAEALDQARRFFSFLPSSSDEVPPVGAARKPSLDPEALRALLPENRRRPYDVRTLISAVLDEDSFFEIAPENGASRITGLGRVCGVHVGLMANNPPVMGGSTGIAAGAKARRRIQLCDKFHLPLVSLVAEPGFMVGPASERAGIERAGARLRGPRAAVVRPGSLS